MTMMLACTWGAGKFGDFPGGKPVLWLDGACAALHHSNQWCYSCYINKQLTHSLSFHVAGLNQQADTHFSCVLLPFTLYYTHDFKQHDFIAEGRKKRVGHEGREAETIKDRSERWRQKRSCGLQCFSSLWVGGELGEATSICSSQQGLQGPLVQQSPLLITPAWLRHKHASKICHQSPAQVAIQIEKSLP